MTSLISARPIKPGGQLRLGAEVEPGEYVLLAVVTDNLAKNKYLVATTVDGFRSHAVAFVSRSCTVHTLLRRRDHTALFQPFLRLRRSQGLLVFYFGLRGPFGLACQLIGSEQLKVDAGIFIS